MSDVCFWYYHSLYSKLFTPRLIQINCFSIIREQINISLTTNGYLNLELLINTYEYLPICPVDSYKPMNVNWKKFMLFIFTLKCLFNSCLINICNKSSTIMILQYVQDNQFNTCLKDHCGSCTRNCYTRIIMTSYQWMVRIQWPHNWAMTKSQNIFK